MCLFVILHGWLDTFWTELYGAVSAIPWASHGPSTQGVEMGVGPLTVTTQWHTSTKVASCPHYLMACWARRGLSSKGRDACTQRHNSDSMELKVQTATQPLWISDASESTGKEGSYWAAWSYWCWPPRASETACPQERYGRVCLECRRSLKASFSNNMPCY